MIMPADPDNQELTCPTCQKRFRLSTTKTPPFCCERCQLIDLGLWFNESIGLPYEGGEGDAAHDPWEDEDE